MVKEGDTVLITVEAKVEKVSTGHGECYLVNLGKQDFTLPNSRRVWVNKDEVEEIETNF